MVAPVQAPSRQTTPPSPTARRGRQRWVSRLQKGLIAFLVVCVLLTAGGYLYVRWRLGQIDRTDIPGLDADESGEVMNVLMVGSDSRERLTGDLAEQAGKDLVSGQRSDTMMILHIDPRQQKAAILSIPRDLYLPIPGTGGSDRINTAYALGGPQRLVQTIQEGLGIRINHYVEVDFVGFQSIVDTVGGVSIYVPAPARDAFSELDIKTAGCVEFNGRQGLAWVRSRHYEYFEAGSWREDPRGDLGRIQRQQDFIRRMMKKAVSSGLTNPVTLNRIIGIGVSHVTLDSFMSTKDIARVARRFRSLDPDTVDMLTLPADGANVGGASVLKLNEAEARPYIDRMNGTLPPEEGGREVRPGDIRVRVLNGNGAEGAAATTGTALQGIGFNVADRGDADSFSYAKTVIRFATGQSAKAQLLQRHLQAGATLQEDRSLRTVDLALIVGADYAGVRAKPAAAAPAPPADAPEAPPTTLPQLSPVPVPKGAPAAQPAC